MINRLAVKNFRCLENVEMAFGDRVTLILGHNGAGKSSIANALLYALTGWCEWTDKRGAGFKALIRHGSDSGTIDVDIPGFPVTRSFNQSGASLVAGEKATTGKAAQAVMEASLPDPDLLAVMLCSNYFIGAAAKEQQDILFKLSGGAANGDWFRERLSDDEAELIDDDLATRLTGAPLADALHKAAFTLRTDANKRVKQLEARLAAAPAPAEQPDTDAVEKELAKLRKQHDKHMEKIGAGAASARAHEAAKRRAEVAEGALRKAKADLEAIGDKPDPTDSAALQKLADRRDSLTQELADSKATHASLAQEYASLKRQLDEFSGLGGKCVLGDVECPLTCDQREAAIDATADKLEDIAKQRDTVEAESAKLAAALLEVTAELEKAQKSAQDALLHNERAAGLLKQIETAQAAYDEALADYQQHGEPNLDSVKLDAEKVQGKIDGLEAQIKAAAEAAAAVNERKTLEINLEESQARAALLDGLVKKLSPDGLPATAMRETIGNVLTEINAALAAFTDYTLDAEPGAEFSLSVTGGDGEKTAVGLLSESEKLSVGAAIQVAIAKLTGFGTVVIDAADRFDGGRRTQLLLMLLSSGVQAIVLATPSNGKRPKADGLTVYELEGGALIGPEAAA